MNKIIPRKNTTAVLGIQLGDEGKGRIVDNKMNHILSDKNISKLYVIRSQGGNNAGHTVEFGDVKIGLHQIPSGIFYEEATEILDSGMVIHVGDLLSEIELVERVSKGISKRIILSEDAMLSTDLQRAREVLNRKLAGSSKGGTGRGIGPTTAEFYDKTGLFVKDLIKENWEDIFREKYTHFDKIFNAFDEKLCEAIVPDFLATKETGKEVTRVVGVQEEFIERTKKDREKLLELNIVKDTFALHKDIYGDESAGIFFEMAQAVGLDPWFGTRPDRTTTPTTIFGISYGTRFWRAQDVTEVIGVMKATYMSSVGARQMPTEATNSWAKWIRDIAHEYGTTTGRPRDVCYIDLPFLKYNIRMSGITKIALTHLDIARREDGLKICTSYKINGKDADYKPDMYSFGDIEPVYINLPSWDVEEVSGVTNYEDLPQESKDYIKFLEKELGFPIEIATTGPERKDIVMIPLQ